MTKTQIIEKMLEQVEVDLVREELMQSFLQQRRIASKDIGQYDKEISVISAKIKSISAWKEFLQNAIPKS